MAACVPMTLSQAGFRCIFFPPSWSSERLYVCHWCWLIMVLLAMNVQMSLVNSLFSWLYPLKCPPKPLVWHCPLWVYATEEAGITLHSTCPACPQPYLHCLSGALCFPVASWLQSPWCPSHTRITEHNKLPVTTDVPGTILQTPNLGWIYSAKHSAQFINGVRKALK